MSMGPADLLRRKSTHFVLWRPRKPDPPPRLVIGRLQPGNPPTFVAEQQFELRPSPAHGDLWEIPAAACNLADGGVYHYWFEITDSNPAKGTDRRIRCTDPTAWTVDWRLLAPRLPAPYGADDQDPAGVVKVVGGRLAPCDPQGDEADWDGDAALDALPAN